MLSVLGLSIVLGMFLYYGFGDRFFSWEPFVIFPSMLAGGVLVHYGQLVRLAGRRHLTKIARFPAEGDIFVLYLRAFDADAKKAGLERPRLRVEALDPLTHLGALFFSGRSMEEHLITCLSSLGPVIAVGNPGEAMPPAGAARLYMPPDAWKEPVKKLMSRARMVVIALDPHPDPSPSPGVETAPGVVWEFIQATRLVPPERLLLVVPEQKKEYERFRTQVAIALGRSAEEHPSLPDFRTPADASVPKERSIGGLVSYSSDWTPTFLRLPGPFPLYDVLHVTLRRAMRPAMNQLIAYENRLPRAKNPTLREWRRRAEKIEFLRRLLAGFVVFELVLNATAHGLPKGIKEWSDITAATLFAAVAWWVTGKIVRKARIRAVPPPGTRDRR